MARIVARTPCLEWLFPANRHLGGQASNPRAEVRLLPGPCPLASAFAEANLADAKTDRRAGRVRPGPRAARGQLVGEELLLRLTDTYGIVDDRAVIIGVVDGDMYERARPEQEFAVVVRSDDERYAVVSTARVTRGPEATRSERIWNVIAREVRALYLHEAVETDPTRVG